MKSIIKWLLIAGGVFVVLIIAAIFIIPQFIDVKKYKPVIEQKVTQTTGRTFSMGDDIDLSVFPWVGVKVTDVRFGNPEGFKEKQMIQVKNFEVRLKVMPLLSRKIEVNTFVLEEPVIHLEKLKNGKTSWGGIAPKEEAKAAPKPKETAPSRKEGVPISELKVDNFAITNGKMVYIDHSTGFRKEITGFNLKLTDISLNKPVNIDFNALLDGKPISLSGSAGPIGATPGKGKMSFDFAVSLLDELTLKLAGSTTDPAVSQAFDIQLAVSPFSPKKVMAALDIPFPVQSKDPAVLEKVSLKGQIKGNPNSVSVSSGVLVLDDSTLNFTMSAKEFSKPNLAFDLQLDAIDVDRYLPKTSDKKSEGKAETATAAADKKPIDYSPLRKLVMDGKVKAGRIRAGGATVTDLIVHVIARNGIITVDPMDLKLYQGMVDSKLVVNVQKNEPVTAVTLLADNIQAGPMITDAAKKELIEGTLKSDLNITVAGDTPDRIKQTLNGKGQLLFTDGAIIGIDLAGSVRNVKSKLGLAEQSAEKPRTDFAELKIPFTAKNGLVTIDGTSLTSPLLRVLMSGKVNLPDELLDVRVEPKFVATLKGQGDTKQRSGVMVPVLITGSFASPKIRPDLKGLIGGGTAGGLNPEDLKKQILGGQDGEKPPIETQKEEVKKQLKSLFPGITD